MVAYATTACSTLPLGMIFRETGPAPARKPRLLDRVRDAIRTRHYSRRTEKAYVHWIKRYIFFHGKRHPVEMGAPEVSAFLTSLAVAAKVAASTQSQALSALLFLYRDVLAIELPWLDDVVRAKRPQYLPVVLTRDEVRAVLQKLDGVTMLPGAAKAALIAHVQRVREQHQADLRRGAGWVELPGALTRKYPNAGRSEAGNGSFRPRVSTWIASPTSVVAIISTNPCSSEQ